MSLQRPLEGVRVVEFEGIGPGPLAGRMLAGMGAQVTALVRPVLSPAWAEGAELKNPLREGKEIVVCDLKSEEGLARARELVAGADVLLEGNRPGVMERLGLGPDVCLAKNPKLIYGRMTGWGQDGPLAQVAGHDLNYVALTGLLSLAARQGERPVIPPTVVGDAGGALGLAFGVACALADVRAGGSGRVVDAAIVDIVAMLGTITQWIKVRGDIDNGLPSPFHDSPYYDVYECADGGQVTVGAIEPQFYDLFLKKLGLDDVDRAQQRDRASWPALKERVAAVFRTRTRKEWCDIMEGTDVCFAPVLSMTEAAAHPHNVARGLFQEVEGGGLLPAIAPRYL